MLPSPAVFEGTYDPLAANTHQGPIGVADASSTGRAVATRIDDALASPDGHRRQANVLATLAGHGEGGGWERRAIGPQPCSPG